MYDEDYARFKRHTLNLEHFSADEKPWALAPPPPFFSHTQMTESVLKHIFFHADYRLKLRRVSPRSQPFLEKMRDAAEQALEKPSVEEKTKLAAWNETLHSFTFLRREPSFHEKEAYQALQKVMIFQYLADYGDYLSEECAAFRDAALRKKDQLSGTELLMCGKTWQMVQKQIEGEKVALEEWETWSKSRNTWNRSDTPTISVISRSRKTLSPLGPGKIECGSHLR